MKRLGIVLGSSPGGGVFQYCQAVLDAVLRFPENEIELVVAYSNPVWLDHLPERPRHLIELRDSLRSRALTRLWHSARLPMSLWRRVSPHLDPNIAAIVGARCDLWLCPSNDSWAFRAPVPALGTIHDLMHIHEPHFPEAGSPEEIREREFHFRETCRWSKGVAVDSEIGREHLCSAYDISPDRVFPLPYIAPKYINDARRDGIAESSYDLPGKYFFYPATFWLHKNHASLFEAIARLRARYPEIRLVLAGSWQNGYDRARQHVIDLGIEEHVIFLGYVPDEHMRELYNKARALVMPTFFGPTNIPPLEAFVTGCPVATSRIYGAEAQLGDAALFFDPASIDEITDSMERLWVDDALCADLARKGKRRASEWGPAQFSERLREIVDALTQPSGPQR